MITTKNKMEFAFFMARHSTCTQSDVQRLLRFAATHQRLQTDACNGPDYSRCRSEAEREYVAKNFAKGTRKLEKCEEKIRLICWTFNAFPVFGEDPRGCTVKIRVPDGTTNDFGQEGICVPA